MEAAAIGPCRDCGKKFKFYYEFTGNQLDSFKQVIILNHCTHSRNFLLLGGIALPPDGCPSIFGHCLLISPALFLDGMVIEGNRASLGSVEESHLQSKS